ncbi:MAG: PPOX class F420-dependent oxidoreductase [Actinomycetota bacterium]|nr:PPOX class F420-dependent oxidoreductase [Actinomycetota bacterium]
MATLTDKHLELLRDENFAVVATVGEDGSPQTSVVWIDTDGENVVFNTTNSRAKGRNLRKNPRVSVSIWDKDDPYRYVEVEGTAELDENGAGEHINDLSLKYEGKDFHTPTNRVIVRVRPERVFDYGVSDPSL